MTTVKVIIDGNFGDSGKGLATDYFASKAKGPCLVVLSNGGSQRGHTVSLANGTRHVFRHFGSGVFAGADTYIPKQYIVNPMNFAMEYMELKSEYKNFLKTYIHPDCLVTTPFDIIANQIIEDSRGDARHGSCGVGIWETILRKGITYGEIVEMFFSDLDRSKVYEYLKYVRDEYFINRISSKRASISTEWSKIIYDERLLQNYVRDLELMIYSCDMSMTIPDFYDTIIFENGQGLLLDQNIEGYGKNTTPSNTGLEDPAKMIAEIQGMKDVEVCYVSRTYMTRHGAGRFDTEWNKIKDKLNYMTDQTNGYHPYQGLLRYGVLDTKELLDRCTKDFTKWAKDNWKLSFMITHLNENPKFDFSELSGYNIYISNGKTRESVKCDY